MTNEPLQVSKWNKAVVFGFAGAILLVPVILFLQSWNASITGFLIGLTWAMFALIMVAAYVAMIAGHKWRKDHKIETTSAEKRRVGHNNILQGAIAIMLGLAQLESGNLAWLAIVLLIAGIASTIIGIRQIKKNPE